MILLFTNMSLIFFLIIAFIIGSVAFTTVLLIVKWDKSLKNKKHGKT